MTVDVARQRALLTWYVANQRQLPWRHAPGGPHPDPYAVLVSELMLQQTRVDSVLQPFARWMARFPDFSSLAAAPVDDAVAAWAGLGYYRRARALHAAACAVVERHGGALPEEAAALAALPGVGAYTVGALRSIAFARPAALVDGNVARVLARWHAARGDESTLRKAAWAAAEAELAPEDAPARSDPSRWSQALMELGALVCRPGQPDCATCPVRAGCRAADAGVAAEIPPARKRAAQRDVHAVAVLLRRGFGASRTVWLRQQPSDARWAGLWQPPMFESEHVGHAQQQARRWCDAHGLVAEPVAEVEHVLTHRRYRVEVWQCDTFGDEPSFDAQPTRWTPVTEVRGRGDGVSRLGVRVVHAAREPARASRATSSGKSS